MKKRSFYVNTLLVTAVLTGLYSEALACDACKAQQPKFLAGITHGPGPGSNWDYVVVSLMVLITAYSFYAMVKCLAKPAEKTHEHIKSIIINP
ncbi:hypothetical protein GWR56_13980 [Mucilaginibacter sp. 14171R-50]|uniref:hypothetical protein n=1 Tax=Mucilaginibacter sp. 14171R-50 TaxID=2703789 RepID=UPI00138CE51F|nr:hypothetical protein [Mucilaginibacter sp. 14171R-50]QHS56598.1 hypothetical protein GWR56_13980 [Mucilaginibacter sp. 14171R-50]